MLRRPLTPAPFPGQPRQQFRHRYGPQIAPFPGADGYRLLLRRAVAVR